MFSGIVQGTAEITSATQRDDILTIEIELGENLIEGLEIGASVAVDGVCLTAVEIAESLAKFDIIEETIRCTTLDMARKNTQANIERSLKFGDEIGGHNVSGHVTSVATISEVKQGVNGRTLQLTSEEKEISYLMPKGFVAIDGISLTVGEVNRSTATFDVHLIPETIAVTTIGEKQVGDQVNLELDSATVAAVESAKQMLANQQ
ncbi:MAG TPA: riboflavin synthase subunit alpha [Candidatus Poseidoniales archaeon]|nr:MAG: riboflavin synthase [Euryarchaeota archaeon]HHZ74724.1 riboflavin synthase subunit alpha [Candidatus Poseidoniales archaeon]PXY75622.1 MAG: riboflavin synthase [Euryarchaeota archaeon]PXY79118.1 MAG: riboflavin synthase [Euryarchaeota archaeon]HIA25555.1 riboflavin synthase subunit alpha [Candidatus Poseidoniales archaeon]